MKKLITAGLVSLVMGISSPDFNGLQAQTSHQEQTQEKNPYFGDGYYMYYYIEKAEYRGAHYFTKDEFIPHNYQQRLNANLTNTPNEKKLGLVWVNYIDFEGDGVYDYVLTQNTEKNLTICEGFRFYPEDKKIDYTLKFYTSPSETKKLILEKTYNYITQKEAFSIGKDFVQRINSLITLQNRFNRFNTKPLDDLVRQEKWQWNTEKENGKYKLTRTGFPIYKYLSESEIEKVENALNK